MDANPDRLPLLKKGDRPLLHLGLFLTTFLCAFESFRGGMGGGTASSDWGVQAVGSLQFAASALAILLAHEMGHFVFARRHGVDSSLPWFIPLPPYLTMFGTLGAVIRLKSRVPTKNALVDIGAAGPLAGLAVALPLMVVGMALSRVDAAPPQPPLLLSDTSLIGAVRELLGALGGPAVDARAPINMVFGDSVLVLALQYLLKGPLAQGTAVYAHPVFIASWFGMLVTMFNLIPVGQLDGGHLTHAWFGDKAVALGKAMVAALGLLTVFVSLTWLVWCLLLGFLIGFRHPPVVRPEEPLSAGRKWVCAACFVFLVLCFIPAPVQLGVAP